MKVRNPLPDKVYSLYYDSEKIISAYIVICYTHMFSGQREQCVFLTFGFKTVTFQ